MFTIAASIALPSSVESQAAVPPKPSVDVVSSVASPVPSAV
jgi:hypothetical protein